MAKALKSHSGFGDEARDRPETGSSLKGADHLDRHGMPRLVIGCVLRWRFAVIHTTRHHQRDAVLR
ncbi:hypothetical protein VI817_006668 [Penicillium citrinum]|nr:hypothetical protein VI817_006668 [Penicillium citrinum]